MPTSLFYDNLDTETERLTKEALNKLKASGVQLVDVDVNDIKEMTAKAGSPILFYEPMVHLKEYGEKYSMKYEDILENIGSPDVQKIYKAGAVAKEVYEEALHTYRPQLQLHFKSLFEKVDAIVFPTTPCPAAPIGQDDTLIINQKTYPLLPTYIQNEDPGSTAGIPGVSIPIGVNSQGLPVGLEFDGDFGSDVKLLEICERGERILNPEVDIQLEELEKEGGLKRFEKVQERTVDKDPKVIIFVIGSVSKSQIIKNVQNAIIGCTHFTE